MKMFMSFLVPDGVKDKLRPVDRGSFQYCLRLSTACIFTWKGFCMPNRS